MHRFIASALAVFAFVARPTRSLADDEAEVRKAVVSFFDSYSAKDVDRYMTLWSTRAPGAADRRSNIKSVFAETGPIKVESLEVMQVAVDGSTARVRVRVRFAGDDVNTKRPYWLWASGRLSRSLEWVKENGEWKVLKYEPAVAERVRALGDAKTTQERGRLLAEAEGDATFVLYRLAELHQRQGRAADAFRACEEALALARGTGASTIEMLLLHQRATLHRARGDFAKGSADAEAALKLLAQRRPLNEGAVFELRFLVAVLKVEAGDAEGAEAEFLAVVEHARQKGDKRLEAQSLSAYGNMLNGRGRSESALTAQRDALKLLDGLDAAGTGIPSDRSAVLMSLGGLLRQAGQLVEAESTFRAALRAAEAGNEPRTQATCLLSLSRIHFQRGEFGEAVRLDLESLDLNRTAGDRVGEARSRHHLGLLYRQTGGEDEALEQLEHAARLFREVGLPAEESEVVEEIGWARLARGDPQGLERVRRFHESRPAPSGADPWKQARAWMGVGRFHFTVNTCIDKGVIPGMQADREAPVRAFASARELFGRSGDRVNEAVAAGNLAASLRTAGRSREALENYRTALGIHERLGTIDCSYRWWAGIAEIHRDEERWAEAADAYRRVLGLLEHVREQAREQSLQIGLLERRTIPAHSPFASLARCLHRTGEFAEAFEVAERGKARALVDLLADGRVNVRRSMTSDQRRTETDLEQAVVGRSTRQSALASFADSDPAQKQEADAQLERALRDLQGFHRRLYLELPDLQTARARFEPVQLKELNAALFVRNPQMCVISYSVGGDGVLIFVLTKGPRDDGPAALAVRFVDYPLKSLIEDVEAFRRWCRSPGDTTGFDSTELHRRLLSPAAEQIAACRHLVIVPDFDLHLLPFHAIQDEDDTPLLEKCAVSYAPSVTALVKMVALGDRRRRTPAQGMLAVGGADFGPSLKPLPASVAEAKQAAEAFGNRPLLGRGAGKKEVGEAMPAARYLHFATHGLINPNSPMESAIALNSGPMAENARLTARELVNLDLKAEMVVLSACDTAMGRMAGSEGLIGLTWALFAAGSPTNVVTQWSVEDNSTADLMQNFYKRLASGSGKAEALRQAQLELRRDRRRRHPYFWAPFVLVGDWRP